MFGLAQADPGSSYIGGIFPFFFLAGLGIGLCFPSVQVAAFTGFTDRDSGLASGLVNTSQEVGGAISVAVLATIAVGLTNDAIATGTEPVDRTRRGFPAIVLRRGGHRDRRRRPGPDSGPCRPAERARGRAGGGRGHRLNAAQLRFLSPHSRRHATVARRGDEATEATTSTGYANRPERSHESSSSQAGPG